MNTYNVHIQNVDSILYLNCCLFRKVLMFVQMRGYKVLHSYAQECIAL